MTTYPNREHENADKAARRRALTALNGIISEANSLHFKIGHEREVDGDDTQVLTGLARQVTQNMAILGALREVREWHAADQKEWAPQTPLRFQCQGCGLKLTDSEVEDHKNRHGLVTSIGDSA